MDMHTQKHDHVIDERTKVFGLWVQRDKSLLSIMYKKEKGNLPQQLMISHLT